MAHVNRLTWVHSAISSRTFDPVEGARSRVMVVRRMFVAPRRYAVNPAAVTVRRLGTVSDDDGIRARPVPMREGSATGHCDKQRERDICDGHLGRRVLRTVVLHEATSREKTLGIPLALAELN